PLYPLHGLGLRKPPPVDSSPLCASNIPAASSSKRSFAGQRPLSSQPSERGWDSPILHIALFDPVMPLDSSLSYSHSLIRSVAIRPPSTFNPATPHFSAFWAKVPSKGFVATMMGSQAGFRAVPQPSNSPCRL